MHARPAVSQLMRRIAVLLALLIALAGLDATAASAQSGSSSGGNSHRPDLVVLGDSFAAGVGNTPYQSGTENTCRRSDVAYGELLDDWGLVNLQASAACSGATTVQVWGPGLAGNVPQPPQIDSITAETDLVTVQALGNDFYFGRISALCILDVCSANAPVLSPTDDPVNYPGGATVRQLLDSIPVRSPGLLKDLYNKINHKIDLVGARAKVIVVAYGDPYPPPTNSPGPFCPPPPALGSMSFDELVTAQEFAGALNTQLSIAARKYGMRTAKIAPLIKGLDVCGLTPAFYRPGSPTSPGAPVGPGASTDPFGTLHPNQLGQTLYTVAVAKRLYF